MEIPNFDYDLRDFLASAISGLNARRSAHTKAASTIADISGRFGEIMIYGSLSFTSKTRFAAAMAVTVERSIHMDAVG